MSNTRSEVNLKAPEKRRGGLDDEVWRIDMLGRTGIDLENKDKGKIQQEDKPRLNNNGTQTEQRKDDKKDHRCVRVCVTVAWTVQGKVIKPGIVEETTRMWWIRTCVIYGTAAQHTLTTTLRPLLLTGNKCNIKCYTRTKNPQLLSTPGFNILCWWFYLQMLCLTDSLILNYR